MEGLPAADDLDGWAVTLSSLPEFEIDAARGFLGIPAVVWTDGAGFVGLLASGRFPGRLVVTPFTDDGTEYVAVDLWHGGNNGQGTTLVLAINPLRMIGAIDDGHFNTRLGPEGELVTEASVWGPFDQAPVEASVIEERYYRVIEGQPKQVSYAECGSLYATCFAVRHYYEMLEYEPERAREKLHPGLLREGVARDAPTTWALNPGCSLGTTQSMTREVPVFLDSNDEPVGYWLVDWSPAGRQWLLRSFHPTRSRGPWSAGP